jgi:putative hemolysin
MKGMIVMLPLALAGCAQSQPAQQAHPIGMANPASVYCQQLGGKQVPVQSRRACAPSASYPAVKR